jgi:hypothetical protein
MDEHIVYWLGAFHDGELQPALENRVREHLAVCFECRQELTLLEELSSLLHSQPVQVPNPVKATARLMAQLPDRAEATSASTTKGFIWWFIPILVVISALILQIASNMTLFMLVVNQLEPGSSLGSLLPGLAQTTAPSQSWSSLLSLSIQGNPIAVLGLVDMVRRSVDLLFVGITWQLALVFVYLAWLVVVWNKRSHLLARPERQMQNHMGSIGG